MRDTSGTDSLAVLVERPADMKRLVDYMLDVWPDAPRIDAQHIGLYGFSFGGYTGLVVVGGNPDLRKGLPSCQTSSLRACKQLENDELPDQPIIHDPRVKAAVIIDPFPVFVFPEETLKEITVPLQLWSSDPAQNADHLSGCCAAAINQRLPAKADYHFVENAKHFSFLATCTPKETQAAPAICTERAGALIALIFTSTLRRGNHVFQEVSGRSRGAIAIRAGNVGSGLKSRPDEPKMRLPL